MTTLILAWGDRARSDSTGWGTEEATGYELSNQC